MQLFLRALALTFFLAICQFSASANNLLLGKEFFKKHLQQKSYDLDTEASAIVLYENTEEQIGGEYGSFAKKHLVRKIIKILKPEALSLADVHIYHKLRVAVRNVSGATYNLSDTGIVISKFTRKELLEKEIGNMVRESSMGLPAVKVGSIIEYSYEWTETYTGSTVAWDIQDEYPKLLTEFTITYPESVEFTFMSHVDAATKEFSSEDSAEASGHNFCTVRQNSREYRWRFWLRRNIPGVKNEPFVVNRHNYEERIDMQITALVHSWGKKNMNASWQAVNKLMWEDMALKTLLHAHHGFLGRELDSVLYNGMTQMEKARAIYKYVRNNYKARNYAKFSISTINFRTIIAVREGSPEELNFLLMAMLIHEGIDARPILLSTTEDVSAEEIFPVIERMDRLACAATIDSDIALLDASKKYLPFGSLPVEYYNGYSHILGDESKGIVLGPNNIKDRTVYSISMSEVTDSTAKLEIIERLGMIRSATFRSQFDEEEERKEQLKKMKAGLPSSLDVLSSELINEGNADTNIVIKHVCRYNFDNTNDLAYINCDLVRFFETNPFKAATRKLPIEFPYKMETVLFVKMQLPPKFAPDSLEKPVILDYMDGSMLYKKNVNFIPTLNTLTVSANFSVNTTAYNTIHYASIRQFFTDMMADNSKIIVLKKNK